MNYQNALSKVSLVEAKIPSDPRRRVAEGEVDDQVDHDCWKAFGGEREPFGYHGSQLATVLRRLCLMAYCQNLPSAAGKQRTKVRDAVSVRTTATVFHLFTISCV